MKKEDVIKHFGKRNKVAKALGYQKSTISNWGEVVPFVSALRLHRISDGAIPLREFEDYHPTRKTIK